MLLGTVRENGIVIPHSKLTATTDQKSNYEKISLTMQTAIRVLK